MDGQSYLFVQVCNRLLETTHDVFVEFVRHLGTTSEVQPFDLRHNHEGHIDVCFVLINVYLAIIFFANVHRRFYTQIYVRVW